MFPPPELGENGGIRSSTIPSAISLNPNTRRSHRSDGTHAIAQYCQPRGLVFNHGSQRAARIAMAASRQERHMTALEAALQYAGRGWSVLPCRDKVPLVRGGVHAATRDLATI